MYTRPYPIISVSDGKLKIKNHSGRAFTEPANKRGAKLFGMKLANRRVTEWCYSSSVDFAHESGGSRADLRAAIMEGYKLRIGVLLEAKIVKTAKRMKLQPQQVRDILTEYGLFDEED